jgi:hypothetical protein
MHDIEDYLSGIFITASQSFHQLQSRIGNYNIKIYLGNIIY